MNQITIRCKVTVGNLLDGLERLILDSNYLSAADVCENDAIRLEKCAKVIHQLIQITST